MTDPVTTEVLRNALQGIAEDMNVSLFRSAFSPVIYEMKDCSVGLFDAEGSVLGQSAGLPIFLGNLGETIRVTVEFFGKENLNAGDVYILNDSYLTGTHLNDITVLAPIFYGEELVGFSANRAHWVDVGAKNPGVPHDAVEIYEEGLRMGPLRIVERGRERPDVIDLICRNSRFPRSALGDLRAQIGSCRMGERRFQQLVDRFSHETIRECTTEIFAQSERLDREAVAAIPDGTYEAEGCLDSDGNSPEDVPVKVRVTVTGEQITIDLTGSSLQRRGATNCGLAQTVSACRVAFKALIHPDLPVTGGTFANLKVVAPEGTIFHAVEPAPCGWYFSALGLLIDLVVKALSPVLWSPVSAHYGDSMVFSLSGTHPKSGSFFLSEPNVGGWGASPGQDGEDCLINNVNGDFKNFPVEVLENKFPLQILQYGYRTDSEGPGQHRGGVGVIREYRIMAEDAALSLWFERSLTPAWGLAGGMPGAAPSVTVSPGTLSERNILKVNHLRVSPGTVVRVKTGGGGGYGPAEHRERSLLEADVRNGLISRTRAKGVYGGHQ